MPKREVQIGRFTLQPHRQLVGPDGPTDLGRKAVDILSVLAAADGAVVTKDELMAAVWGDVVVEENSIQAQIVTLRKVLGEDADCLATVRGLGYRLTLNGAVASLSAAAKVPNSLAVLPFANLTGDPALDYLGEGMAEELINTLSRAPGLKVPSRTASFAYRGREVDPRQIARDLGVGLILEGSVRSGGDRVRVTAQLIDAETGFHRWSENFEHEGGDLFALQDDIAASIAEALQTQIAPIAHQHTHNVEAYQLCLQADSIASRPTGPYFLRSIELYRKSIELDPDFARAFLGLSLALEMGSQWGVVGLSSLSEVRHCALHALSLDPSLSEAHAILGSLAARSGDWIKAEDYFQSSIAGDPQGTLAYSGYAVHVHGPSGHLARAVKSAEFEFKLAPAAPFSNLDRALMASINGDHQRALEMCAMAVELGYAKNQPPLTAVLAQAACAQGRFAEAAKWMTLTLALPLQAAGGGAVADMVYGAIGGDGSPEFAARAVDHLLAAPGVETVMIDWSATGGIMIDWYTRLGRLDRAYAIANRLIIDWEQCGWLDVVSLMPIWIPELLPFRRDPRFNGFVTRLGLIPYWERFGPPDGCELRDRVLIVG
jgi:TolB-like protein